MSRLALHVLTLILDYEGNVHAVPTLAIATMSMRSEARITAIASWP